MRQFVVGVDTVVDDVLFYCRLRLWIEVYRMHSGLHIVVQTCWRWRDLNAGTFC